MKPAKSETILEKIGVYLHCPFALFVIVPGRISTSSPTFIIPYRILPPTTPPFNFSNDSPGLLTSNDLYFFVIY